MRGPWSGWACPLNSTSTIGNSAVGGTSVAWGDSCGRFIFLPALQYAYNAENNCEESKQLPSGTIIVFTVYNEKYPEYYCDNGE